MISPRQHADDHRLQRRDRRDQLHLHAADNETHASGAGENSLFEDFLVTLTDQDGDIDTATLSVDIVDDVPTARADTDTSVGRPCDGQRHNRAPRRRICDSDTNAADTVGADNATVTSVSGSTGGSDSTFSAGVLTVNGQLWRRWRCRRRAINLYPQSQFAGGGGSPTYSTTP